MEGSEHTYIHFSSGFHCTELMVHRDYQSHIYYSCLEMAAKPGSVAVKNSRAHLSRLEQREKGGVVQENLSGIYFIF